MRIRHLFALFALVGCASPVRGQSGERLRPAPGGYGSLSQDDLSLRVRNDDLEIRFVPLDSRVTRLLARDAYEALLALVERNRRGIDSVASQSGVSQPGLALVSFFGLRPDARFDAKTLTLLIRSRVFSPLGVVPVTPKFSSGQLGVRDQASAIYVFEEEIPVTDSFTLSYGALTSEDWHTKQSALERERARVAARARGERRDTVVQKREQ